MNQLNSINKGILYFILSTLFTVAVLSILSMCCGFFGHATHQTSNHNQHTPEHHVISCTDSLPSQSPCHAEKNQQVAILPQTKNEEIGEKNNHSPDMADSFITAFRVYIPPKQAGLSSYTADTQQTQNNKLLITQLPRAHLG